jgi:hypothetical protein
MKQLAASLDDKQLLSAAKAKIVLGWTPRTAREAVVATKPTASLRKASCRSRRPSPHSHNRPGDLLTVPGL